MRARGGGDVKSVEAGLGHGDDVIVFREEVGEGVAGAFEVLMWG